VFADLVVLLVFLLCLEVFSVVWSSGVFRPFFGHFRLSYLSFTSYAPVFMLSVLSLFLLWLLLLPLVLRGLFAVFQGVRSSGIPALKLRIVSFQTRLGPCAPVYDVRDIRKPFFPLLSLNPHRSQPKSSLALLSSPPLVTIE